MHDHTQRDDELAEFTDRLLAGDDPAAPATIESLASTVRRLHDAVEPGASVEPTFRKRLTQRLEMEWDLHYQRRPRWWRDRRMRQLAAVIAAGVVLVLAVVILLAAYEEETGMSIQGTTLGPLAGIVLIALLGIGLISMFVLLRRRH